MRTLWTRYAARFDSLTLRERAMVAGAVLVLIVVLGYVALLEPQWARGAQLRRQLAQQAEEIARIEEQLRGQNAARHDPDAASRAELATLRKQLDEVDARLRDVQQAVVPPERMADLLEQMLKRNRGLQLVSLRSLPAAPLLERKEGAAKDAGRGHDEAAAGGEMFRHGVEIIVAGSYADLTRYVAELERLPHKMYWNALSLTVDDYPRARLALTVYTLSLDKAWLSL